MSAEKTKLVRLRIANAKKTLNEIDVLVENEFWNTTVNRLYYACFYAVTALLLNYDLDSKTHGGVQRLFGLHFIKTGKINEKHGEFYSTLFQMRQDADYEAEVEYEKDDVIKLIGPAHELVSGIEAYLLKG